MFAQTLPSERSSSTSHRSSATQHGAATTRAKHRGQDPDHATRRQPARINDLMVVLSASEPHREVAIRAQLLARDTPVSRTALVTPDSAKWQRFVYRISTPGHHLSASSTDISTRIVRASFPGERTRIASSTAADDVITRANASDLVLVGRRRTFPWAVAPLAGYARRLLRRSRTPVLVVGDRPRGSYRNVVIATDLETDVGPALKWARDIAPRASFTLLHVYRGLFEGKLQWAGVPDRDVLEHRLAAQRRAALGMTALTASHRSDEVRRALLAHGAPVHDVLRKARELEADLIVVIKRTHSWWAETLGFSVSVEIATRADRDVLVVHG